MSSTILCILFINFSDTKLQLKFQSGLFNRPFFNRKRAQPVRTDYAPAPIVSLPRARAPGEMSNNPAD